MIMEIQDGSDRKIIFAKIWANFVLFFIIKLLAINVTLGKL